MAGCFDELAHGFVTMKWSNPSRRSVAAFRFEGSLPRRSQIMKGDCNDNWTNLVTTHNAFHQDLAQSGDYEENSVKNNNFRSRNLMEERNQKLED